MTEQTIAIYCFIDDFFLTVCRKDDVHCKISDAELLTTALLAARYFYGFRVQVITTQEGLPIAFYIYAGTFADVTALQAMPLDLPQGSCLYADAGYTCYEVEDLLAECEQVENAHLSQEQQQKS